MSITEELGIVCVYLTDVLTFLIAVAMVIKKRFRFRSFWRRRTSVSRRPHCAWVGVGGGMVANCNDVGFRRVVMLRRGWEFLVGLLGFLHRLVCLFVPP